MDPLTSLPATITAGDRVDLLLTVSDYPATAGWSLTLAVAGPSVDTWTSTASGAAHALTLPVADTALLAAGTYRWSLKATKAGGYATTVATGVLAVTADLTQAAAGEQASWAETTLAVVEAVIANTATSEMKMYMIGGRQVMSLSLGELMTLRAQLRADVARERSGGRRAQLAFGTAQRGDPAWS